MDFHQLMNIAASKQENLSKTKVSRYSLELPAPKKEEKKTRPRSKIVQSLIKEKEQDREASEKKNVFKIPKKTSVDKEEFIKSLFDDGDGPSCQKSKQIDTTKIAEVSRLGAGDSRHGAGDSRHGAGDSRHGVVKSKLTPKKHEKHKEFHCPSNGVPSTTSQSKQEGLSEREKILAKLQAIKQRTLEAIHKENALKGRRPKGEKSQRKSSKTDDKHEDKAKSAEIVRDDVSSDDELVPSALDVMLSERSAKLEKEKIARMAKQAWERATKKPEEKNSLSTTSHKSSFNSSSQKSSNMKKASKKTKHKDKSDSSNLKSSSKSDLSIFPKPNRYLKSSSKQLRPPPMDFKSILAMAEEKQKEPPKALVLVKKKEEEDRPLTQEEKDRKERQKSQAYQAWLRVGGERPGEDAHATSSTFDNKLSAAKNGLVKKSDLAGNGLAKKSDLAGNGLAKKSDLAGNGLAKKSDLAGNGLAKKSDLAGNGLAKKSDLAGNGLVKKSDLAGNGLAKKSDLAGNGLAKKSLNKTVLVCGEPQDTSNPFDRIMKQVHRKRPTDHSSSDIPKKVGRIIDSDEDSDLDGFIDDGDDGELDYSKEIQKLFGYNKNKYKDEDDDDLNDMEADYSTVMREEKRSAKLGLMEDMEDIRREQEELKRKAFLKNIKRTKKQF